MHCLNRHFLLKVHKRENFLGSDFELKILPSQKRGGKEGYQSIHLDFGHSRRCFLDTLKGLVF
jgi:hypothetical protein